MLVMSLPVHMIEYRKASEEELDLIAKIRVDFLLEINNITENEMAEMYKSIRNFLSVSFYDGSFVSWVAVDGAEIIATSGVSFYTVPPNKHCVNGKVAYISNMFTYPKYRNLGIASKLFELTVDEAKSNGCKKVILNATDMGRHIYEKYGFINSENDMVYWII